MSSKELNKVNEVQMLSRLAGHLPEFLLFEIFLRYQC